MTTRLFHGQVNRAIDETGAVVPGAFLRVFLNNTTTLAEIFASLDPDVPLAQPVEADGDGIFETVFMPDATPVRVAHYDADDVILPGFPIDDVVPLAASQAGAALIAFEPTEAVPATDVQSAIELVAALSSDQTTVVNRHLTPIATTGSSNAYVITPDPAITAYGDFQFFNLQIDRANTGAATLNVSDLGTRDLQKLNTSSAPIALNGGDLQPGMIIPAWYDGTRFIALVAPTLGQINFAAVDIHSNANTSQVRLSGGNAANIGGNIHLFGGAHATDANDINYDATDHVFRNQAGTEDFLRLNTSQITITEAPVRFGAETDAGGDEAGILITTDGSADGAGFIGACRADAAAARFQRITDGTIVQFSLGGTDEGSVSGTGTTIAYNTFLGSHWSQLLGGGNPPISRGTIVESIAEMCEWPDDKKPNEHLPRFKVSDTASSRAVYGVFLWWDEDGDACIGSLGADRVRIGKGVSVEIGDLVESAGDGTGRVQKGDTMRSRTVAKVTSTHVIETYRDGSYTVPATLHCG